MNTTISNSRKYINITNGTIVNLKLVIDDVASFNRYIIKEHGNSLQGEDIFGKTPAIDCVANCIYDELSGWLDNPGMLGFTVLDITFDENKIKEESVELSAASITTVASTFDLIKLIGEIASKNHEIESASNGAELQLINLREKARKLLKELARVKGV